MYVRTYMCCLHFVAIRVRTYTYIGLGLRNGVLYTHSVLQRYVQLNLRLS